MVGTNSEKDFQRISVIGDSGCILERIVSKQK